MKEGSRHLEPCLLEKRCQVTREVDYRFMIARSRITGKARRSSWSQTAGLQLLTNLECLPFESVSVDQEEYWYLCTKPAFCCD